MNLYGFRKCHEGELRFEHPDFLRDAPSRLTKVLRAPPPPQRARPKKKKVIRKPLSDDDYSDGDKTPSPKRSRCDVAALFGRDEQGAADLFSLSAPTSPSGSMSFHPFPPPPSPGSAATLVPPPPPVTATPSPSSLRVTLSPARPRPFGALVSPPRCRSAPSGSLDSNEAPFLRRGFSDGSDGWQRALDAGPAPPAPPLWTCDTPTGGFGATFFGDDPASPT